MSSTSPESQASAAPRLALAPGTLIAVGVWACLFAAFVVLGLQS